MRDKNPACEKQAGVCSFLEDAQDAAENAAGRLTGRLAAAAEEARQTAEPAEGVQETSAGRLLAVILFRFLAAAAEQTAQHAEQIEAAPSSR